jgi:hypothetical protein
MTPKTDQALRSFAPSELNLYHRNPRIGSVSDIEDSLRAHGQYKPIVVNVGTHTGRPYEVLAGNHMVKAFRNLQEREPGDPRWRSVTAYLIDVDDDRAARIVLVDNKTSSLGGFDDVALADVLRSLPDLAGTAYTEDDLGDLLAKLEEDLPPTVDPADHSSVAPAPDGRRVQPDGLIISNDLQTDKERYADKATRLVVLAMEIPVFIWAQDHLNALRAEYGVETNTEAVVRLLEEKTGTSAPAVAAESEDDEGNPAE